MFFQGMAVLTDDEANAVMAATNAAIQMDIPDATSADKAEFLYGMRARAKNMFNSPLPKDALLIDFVRNDSGYQKGVARIKKTGTFYASTEDRAQSPYAILGTTPKGSTPSWMKWALGGGVAIIALGLLGKRK